MVSNSNFVVEKIVSSGTNVAVVPVERDSKNIFFGKRDTETSFTFDVGIPRSYVWRNNLLFLRTSTHMDLERAFTTDAPTPCSPPDTLYADPPNFPPA